MGKRKAKEPAPALSATEVAHLAAEAAWARLKKSADGLLAIRKIENRTAFSAAAHLRRAIKTAQLRVEESFKPIKRSLFEAHKAATKDEAKFLDLLDDLAKPLDEMLVAFFDECRAAAQWTVDNAKPDSQAEAQVEAAAIEAPKIDGLTFQDEWGAEVYDLLALVKAVAAGDSPLEYLVPNQKLLDKEASTYRNPESGGPGVRFKSRVKPKVWAFKESGNAA